MKKILLIGLCLGFLTASMPLGAQWARSYACMQNKNNTTTLPRDIQQTEDGGYIIAGAFFSYDNNQLYDGLIFKLNPQGEVEWKYAYGAGWGQDCFNSVRQTRDGGYVLGGMSSSGPLIIKLDPFGGVEWQRVFLGSLGSQGYDEVLSLRQTFDGGYIALGRFGHWLCVVKLTPSGNIEWQYIYNGNANLNEKGFILPTSDGGYIVAGCFSSVNIYQEDAEDVWVFKLGPAGNMEWQRSYGGSLGDQANSILQTLDGGYIVVGDTASFGVGDRDIWILKLTPGGDIEWQRTYGGPYRDHGAAVQQTDDGGFIVVGNILNSNDYSGYSFSIFKLYSNGDIQWEERTDWGYAARAATYNGYEDEPTNIQNTTDGGFVTVCSGLAEIEGKILVLKLGAHGEIDSHCKLITNASIAVMNTTVSPVATNAIPLASSFSISSGNIPLRPIELSATFVCRGSATGNKKGIIRR
jgi:hypothetical protein